MRKNHRRIERLSTRYSVYRHSRSSITHTSVVLSMICKQDNEIVREKPELDKDQSPKTLAATDEQQLQTYKPPIVMEGKHYTSTCISLAELDEPQPDPIFVTREDNQHPKPKFSTETKELQDEPIRLLGCERTEKEVDSTSLSQSYELSQNRVFVTEESPQQLEAKSTTSVSGNDAERCTAAAISMKEESIVKPESPTAVIPNGSGRQQSFERMESIPEGDDSRLLLTTSQ